MHKWTVMINLAGDNNLSSECVYALTEMKRIGSSNQVAVIAQLDTTVHEFTPLFIEPEKERASIHGVTGDELALAQKAKEESETVTIKLPGTRRGAASKRNQET